MGAARTDEWRRFIRDVTRETAYLGEGRGRGAEVTLRRPSGSKKCSSRASPQSKTARRERLEIVDTTERAVDGWRFPLAY